jgi:hypothetical protein
VVNEMMDPIFQITQDKCIQFFSENGDLILLIDHEGQIFLRDEGIGKDPELGKIVLSLCKAL